jgi:hypothetical protein
MRDYDIVIQAKLSNSSELLPSTGGIL